MASQDVLRFFGGLASGASEELKAGRESKRKLGESVALEREKRRMEVESPTPFETTRTEQAKAERDLAIGRFGLEQKDLERKRLSDFITGVTGLTKAASFDSSDLLLALPAIQEAQAKGVPISDVISGIEQRKQNSTLMQIKTIGSLMGLEIKLPKETEKQMRVIGGKPKSQAKTPVVGQQDRTNKARQLLQSRGFDSSDASIQTFLQRNPSFK